HTIRDGHLYTAVSIYLILGLQWFAVYSAFDVLYPGSIQHNTPAKAGRHAELLYFSLITLSTVGYGDVVPVQGEVRILAALEGIAGVLYIAITVALLVSAHRPRDNSA
ncbi:MAG TPA: ion channel, partial [Candidatus Acidoferrum sp.]|nr:ion channel [Candidatus Acidoferrum sp.]